MTIEFRLVPPLQSLARPSSAKAHLRTGRCGWGKKGIKTFYFAFSFNFFFWAYIIKYPECENNNRISAGAPIAKSRSTKFGESPPVYWEMRVGNKGIKN